MSIVVEKNMDDVFTVALTRKALALLIESVQFVAQQITEAKKVPDDLKVQTLNEMGDVLDSLLEQIMPQEEVYNPRSKEQAS